MRYFIAGRERERNRAEQSRAELSNTKFATPEINTERRDGDFLRIMPDFRSITGLSGRIFGGAVNDEGGGADGLRLKAFSSAMAGTHYPPTQVKCPRCESLNTKFCYYNNYNLSQPRHFCKACRRYWTRGGVLRNVPVGGGCRKTKRSSSKSSSESSSTEKENRRKNSGSRSSSDSSGITPTAISSYLDGFPALPDSVIHFNSSSSTPNPSNPNFAQPVQEDSLPFAAAPAEIFPDSTTAFPSLMATAANDQSMLRFNFVDPPHFHHPDPPQQNLDDLRPHEFIYQTAPGEPPPCRDPGSAIDWPPGMDPSFYEMSCPADPSAYWNQNHWGDGDSSLYLP